MFRVGQRVLLKYSNTPTVYDIIAMVSRVDNDFLVLSSDEANVRPIVITGDQVCYKKTIQKEMKVKFYRDPETKQIRSSLYQTGEIQAKAGFIEKFCYTVELEV